MLLAALRLNLVDFGSYIADYNTQHLCSKSQHLKKTCNCTLEQVILYMHVVYMQDASYTCMWVACKQLYRRASTLHVHVQ